MIKIRYLRLTALATLLLVMNANGAETSSPKHPNMVAISDASDFGPIYLRNDYEFDDSLVVLEAEVEYFFKVDGNFKKSKKIRRKGLSIGVGEFESIETQRGKCVYSVLVRLLASNSDIGKFYLNYATPLYGAWKTGCFDSISIYTSMMFSGE